MKAFKCNMWLISILTISYIYGCVGEEEVLFTKKPPNIEQTDINKVAIFEVNTQIASDGVEDSSTPLQDQTTYATEILPTDAIDRDNGTETTTIAANDNGSEIDEDWGLLDEGYLDGDNYDLDELAMADYDSYANNDTEDVSIKEMLKMNLSDEKLKGIMIIQDWLNNKKENSDEGAITTTEFSEDKYDEYLKTFNYDNIDDDLLNEEHFNTERTETIPELKLESTTEFATTPVQEDIIQSDIRNKEIELTAVGPNDMNDFSEDDILEQEIKFTSTTEVPETTTELTTPNTTEQVEEESFVTVDDEDNVYVTLPTSGKIQNLDQNIEESEDALNYSSTESNEIDTTISNEATTENNKFEELDATSTTTETFMTISHEVNSSETTTDYDSVIDLTTIEYVLTTTVENEDISNIPDISKSTPVTTTESVEIIQETTEAKTTQSSIESQNNEVSEQTTELVESLEKIEEIIEENSDDISEFTTIVAIDNQTENIEDNLDELSENQLKTQSVNEIQTESKDDEVLTSEILDEFEDDITTITSTIQTEFSTDESATADNNNTNIDNFNVTESTFTDDLQDTFEMNSTMEPLTDAISSLEGELEEVNIDTFNTTESVFEDDSQDKVNSTDSISKLDEEDIVEDIELTTAADLDVTTTDIVESMKNNTEAELNYHEDTTIEVEGENLNNSTTTQFPIDDQTEITEETDVASNEKGSLKEPERISIDIVDLEENSTPSNTLLNTEFSLDIQTESEIEAIQESVEFNFNNDDSLNETNSDEKLENQNHLEETETEKIIDMLLSELYAMDNETGIDNSTELFIELNKKGALVDNQAGGVNFESEIENQTEDVEVTTKIVDEYEKQNIDVDNLTTNSMTTQSIVDVETESQKLETTTDIYNNTEAIPEEVTTLYGFNSTEEIRVKMGETSQNNESEVTTTSVFGNEGSTESVIYKEQELKKEFVESFENDKEDYEDETLYSNVANENENKETELQMEIEDLANDEDENVKEIIDKYNSIETLSEKPENNLQTVNTQNNDLLKEEDFENDERFIDIMHSSEYEWNANKDLFTTRSSTAVIENVNEDKMFTLSESASEEIQPIVVENAMEIETDPISGTTERVEKSTSESLYKEPTEETELNLNNKKQDDDLSAEETEIDKIIVENDLVEDTASEDTSIENNVTTELVLNGKDHQEVVTKTVPIEESTMSAVIDESDEADITSLNNVESDEDETRSSTEFETVIPIRNNGRFIFDLLTSTVTPLSEETTDSPTEKLTKDLLSEEKINLDKMYIADKEIILTEVQETTTTEKSIGIIKDGAVFYNINLKPNSNTERHNILLNLKEDSSSSEEIVDYLETISEDDSDDTLDEIFNYSEEFDEALNEIEEILEKNAQIAPFITRSILNNNKEQCLSLNMSMTIKINETNIIVPETAKISGNCSEYFLVSWRSAFDASENNSIYFNLIHKNDCVLLQSIGVHVMKDDGELLIDEANADLSLDVDDTNYVMLNNGLSVQLNMSLKRKNVALAEKPTTLKSMNTLALQITSGIASILIVLAVVGVFIYRRHRGQTRILKVTIDK